MRDGLPANLLESWLRESYFTCEFDIGGSGVQPYSFRELREISGLSPSVLDEIVFFDSDSYAGGSIRRALARRFLNGDERRVLATHGSSEALFLVLQSLLEAGDRVVVLDPCYQQLRSIAEAKGCEVLRWRVRKATDRFYMDMDEFESLVHVPVKLVIANFPHNPTGVTISQAELGLMIERLDACGAYLLWDGAFSDLTLSGSVLADPIRSYSRTISTGTLSKAYGFPGMRVGWCLGPREVLDRCVALRDYVTLFLSPFVEYLAAVVIDNASRFIRPRLEQAKRNLASLREWTHAIGDEVIFREPSGGVCTLLEFPRIADTEGLCTELMQRYSTLVVPGLCFGHANSIRLGFGGDPKALASGLTAVSKVLGLPMRS